MICKSCNEVIEGAYNFCPLCGDGVSDAEGITPLVYIGFWRRVAAFSLDLLLTTAATTLLVITFFYTPMGEAMLISGDFEKTIDGVSNAFALALTWSYYTGFESSRWQATIGKKMLGIKVASQSGGRIGFGRANIRYLSKILTMMTLMIGFLPTAFTKKKRALHDYLASTVVIKAQP